MPRLGKEHIDPRVGDKTVLISVFTNDGDVDVDRSGGSETRSAWVEAGQGFYSDYTYVQSRLL